MERFSLAVACAFGLETVVKKEMEQLGHKDLIAENGKIFTVGDLYDISRFNVRLRCADRVYIRVANFCASDFDSLFDGIRAVDWKRFVNPKAKITVTTTSAKSTLTSHSAIQSIGKKAICSKIQEQAKLQRLPETDENCRVEISVFKNDVNVFIDTTGFGLNRRGYRDHIGVAPMKETLASAILMLSNWKPGKPLLDPFCGSGTIPIEAALMAQNRAPGISRDFDFQFFNVFDKTVLERVREEARADVEEKPNVLIFGSDIDEEMTKLSLRHAARAGVDKLVRFSSCDVANCSCEAKRGVIVTNPPYGERLADKREAENAIKSLFTMSSGLGEGADWNVNVITPADVEKLTKRRADKRRKLYNGNIECTLYSYFKRTDRRFQ